jgi:2-phospho-L-lactate transferase/gluconeogenesis factor (CofD/UPF0052 family)
MHDIERLTLALVVAAAVAPRSAASALGHLEDNIAAVAHHLRADLDQLVLQTRQRPVLDRLRRRQRAQEIAEVVGERMKLEPHPIGGERSR